MSDPKKNIQSFRVAAIFLFLAVLAPGTALAGARPDDVPRLSGDLTPTGAERGPNPAGTIPAWEGGIDEPPAAHGDGDHYPDPFAAESPLFRIDASNLDQHREFLGAGQAEMLKAYPDLYLSVYPSHRTLAYPPHVYERTAANGASGKLTADGNGVAGVAGGIPFPFPETGEELIWNHLLRYKGSSSVRHIRMIAPTASGAFNEISMTVTAVYPYYQPGATLESIDNRLALFQREVTTPPSMAGAVLLVHESLNQVVQPRKAWVYRPGQRRVVRAPNIAYDSPSGGTDGMHVADMRDMFNGALDRFDWELLGKREMYVPYNAYRLDGADLDYDSLALPGHLDPQHLRYELHRVWVVEARLRNGQRHINPRRTFYLDEDSYQILMIDHYDDGGTVWRFSEAHPINFYDARVFWSAVETHHDLKAGRYVAFRLDPGKPSPAFNREMDTKDFTPQALRRKGLR
jgi:hypothetical protein